MFIIVEVDGFIRSSICKNNKADKYGEPKKFGTIDEAKKWIEKHSYKGMSHRYEIVEV